MSSPLVECVPNFSEGRDPAVVDAIATAIAVVPGVLLLDRTMDADHHRSVITFAAPPHSVVEAALAGVAKAVELIDLTRHHGEHPRIGACDVLPFVPLRGITLAECAQLAREAAEEIWRRLQVPIYLYEAAARSPERVRLENIRRGGFEGLRQAVHTDPSRTPDVGGPGLHPTAGATVAGARPFLIACNINLDSPDLELARRIARTIRHSSGGLPCVKALGLMLHSRGQAQVSMNLTDFEQTSLQQVYAAVEAEAARAGVSIAGTEIIGLIPRRALELAAAQAFRIDRFSPAMILENRIEEAQAARPPLESAAEAAIELYRATLGIDPAAARSAREALLRLLTLAPAALRQSLEARLAALSSE